jgi:hypothetical protein
MPGDGGLETSYGPGKYAAFHLLLGVWIRRYAVGANCVYVTLGGTELRDIESLVFINHQLGASIFSFELEKERYRLACASRDRLAKRGIKVECTEGSIFSYERTLDAKHLFFIDLEGICTPEFVTEFASLLSSNTLREGDGLFITSHLGHNPGYDKTVFKWFEDEFDSLHITSREEKRDLYKLAHPSFVLYRALGMANLRDDILLRCIGSLPYYDTSPMGLYGYVLSPGKTIFDAFISNTPFFAIPRVRRSSPVSAMSSN